uniref:Uncharacterized protein n=1 Tax=Bionectria ochroleuca TaxID=29856 RepID=A0A8H7NAK8_BIOOC
MAGRPTGNPYGGPSGNRDDLLLDLDNEQPVYNDGQRSNLNDDEMMRNYNLDQESQARPSVSYDDFVGAQQTSYRPPNRDPGNLRPTGGLQRQYSQTSDLDNYQRYADDYDDHDDSYGGPSGQGIPQSRSNARHRNSVLGLGGGFLGRVKNRLGMGQGYSEMDLPLTESRDGGGDAGSSQSKKKSNFDMGNFKFGFGRSKPDPSTLGPRIIYLNNPRRMLRTSMSTIISRPASTTSLPFSRNSFTNSFPRLPTFSSCSRPCCNRFQTCRLPIRILPLHLLPSCWPSRP